MPNNPMPRMKTRGHYHSDKKLVYVAHSDTVSVLDAKTGELKHRIATGGKRYDTHARDAFRPESP